MSEGRKVWWREWLWDWKVAEPYFVIAGVGSLAMILVRFLAAIGWLR